LYGQPGQDSRTGKSLGVKETQEVLAKRKSEAGYVDAVALATFQASVASFSVSNSRSFWQAHRTKYFLFID